MSVGPLCFSGSILPGRIGRWEEKEQERRSAGSYRLCSQFPYKLASKGVWSMGSIARIGGQEEGRIQSISLLSCLWWWLSMSIIQLLTLAMATLTPFLYVFRLWVGRLLAIIAKLWSPCNPLFKFSDSPSPLLLVIPTLNPLCCKYSKFFVFLVNLWLIQD